MNRTATGDPLPPLLAQETGQISGSAVDSDGQPLADHTVRLWEFVMVGEMRGREVRGTDQTDTDGRFSFTGLQASEYVLEVLVADEVVASASATLADGDMQVTGITVTRLANEGGLSRGAKIAIGAGVVGAIVVVIVMMFCSTGGCYEG